MNLLSIFPGEGSPWQTWVIPATGLIAALLILFAGRLVFSRRRAGGKGKVGGTTKQYDPFDMGSLTERRVAARRKGNPIELILRNDDPEGEPGRAWVIDRSMGGLCLQLFEEFAAGKLLNLKPTNSPPGTPWIQIEVRNCKKTNDGYEAGCQFVRTPPWAILLLFG